MKAIELIARLQELVEKYGDGHVIMVPDDDPYLTGHVWFDTDDGEYILE